MLIGIKTKKKLLTELGDSDRLKIHINPSKIYINPGIKVHSHDLFSKTTAPMILKFHMQHDKAAGLQKSKIQAAWESNMAAFAKNSSTTKINFSCWTTWYIWLKFCIECKLHLDFLELSKWKKKSITELGHNDLLPV